MSDTSSDQPAPKTVFIVGAGASKEVGLPIGSELRDRIANALDIQVARGVPQLISGDDLIYEALKLTASQNPTQRDLARSLQAACWKIRDAMQLAISIDNYMDVHSDDKHIELFGKLAIVRTILEAEAESMLVVDPLKANSQINFKGAGDTWFRSFFQRLTENCQSKDLAKRLSSIVLVIFNYDRCIEHYLYYALQSFYYLSAQEVASLLRGMEIYHPYGTVGSLPWLGREGAIEYGATPDLSELLELSSQIKTFTEVTDEASNDMIAIRSHMSTSRKLVFLGFAFHRLNLDFLMPKVPSHRRQIPRKIFATAWGLSESDVSVISGDLGHRLQETGNQFNLRNTLTCSQLFHEYSQMLSFT